ncbi:MAG: hypothetical protein ACTSVM_04000 [Candidatus Ranarchaeia archaeon]
MVDFPWMEFVNDLDAYMTIGRGLLITLGSFIATVSIALGFIFWFTSFEASKGKRMVVGGFFLLIILQWLSVTPWIISSS